MKRVWSSRGTVVDNRGIEGVFRSSWDSFEGASNRGMESFVSSRRTIMEKRRV